MSEATVDGWTAKALDAAIKQSQTGEAEITVFGKRVRVVREECGCEHCQCFDCTSYYVEVVELIHGRQLSEEDIIDADDVLEWLDETLAEFSDTSTGAVDRRVLREAIATGLQPALAGLA